MKSTEAVVPRLPRKPLLLALTLLTARLLSAQTSTPQESGPEVEAAKKFRAYARQQATTYDIRAPSADGRQLKLGDEPILRWSDSLGGRQAHGEVFLSTDEGRPAAVISLYQWTAPDGAIHEHHEFCTLATGPLVIDGPGNRDWSPPEAAVTFTQFPAAAPSAPTPRQ